MKVETKYIAYDGTEFRSEQDCIKYENEFKEGILLFDDCSNRMDVNEMNFQNCAVISLSSPEAVEELDKLIGGLHNFPIFGNKPIKLCRLYFYSRELSCFMLREDIDDYAMTRCYNLMNKIAGKFNWDIR